MSAAKTNAERQRKFRARKAQTEATEVRKDKEAKAMRAYLRAQKKGAK